MTAGPSSSQAVLACNIIRCFGTHTDINTRGDKYGESLQGQRNVRGHYGESLHGQRNVGSHYKGRETYGVTIRAEKNGESLQGQRNIGSHYNGR